MRILLTLLWVFAATSIAGTLPDPYSGSGGAFLGTPSEQDIQSGRAIFGPEKCSSFTVGKTTKLEIIEKLGRPAGWSTERDGTSLLEYDYVEPAGVFGMRRVIATFFNFDRSRMLFKIKCPGFDQAIAPKDVATIEYKCDAPIPSLAADQTGPLKINYWFSKDHKNVYMSKDPIPGADPDTFRLACCAPCEVCGEDKNRCYWFEHPVPCDCGKHSGGEFPIAIVDVPEGKAVIGKPFSISSGLPNSSRLSAGYRVVDPGEYTLGIECWIASEQKTVITELAVTIDHGIYRLERPDNKQCQYKLTRPALVLGREDGPEIRLLTSDKKPAWQLELEPGKQAITVICREVQRSAVLESSTELTLDLLPGAIYRVNATFRGPDYKCIATASKQ